MCKKTKSIKEVMKTVINRQLEKKGMDVVITDLVFEIESDSYFDMKCTHLGFTVNISGKSIDYSFDNGIETLSPVSEEEEKVVKEVAEIVNCYFNYEGE